MFKQKTAVHIVVVSLLLIAASALSTAHLKSQDEPPSFDPDSIMLERVWETTQEFRVPEAVLFDAEKERLYVANINGGTAARDGNGFISTLSLEGEIIELNWATGLNGPKGMAFFEGILYVADLNEIVEIDTDTGEILAKHAPEFANFLNDLTVTETGVVYASDTFAESIYKLEEGETSLILRSPQFSGLNGIHYDEAQSRLLTGSFNTGALLSVTTEEPTITTLLQGFGALDGIEADGNGNYWVSDFNGLIYLTDLNQRAPILNRVGGNAADIEYIIEHRMLFVPTFNGNQVIAFQVVDVE